LLSMCPIFILKNYREMDIGSIPLVISGSSREVCQLKQEGLNILPIVINTLHLAPSYALQFILICGILLSSLTFIFDSFRNTISYFCLWIIHLSAFQVGGVFLWFQWDTLLLESGAICILLANLPFIGATSADNISLFLIRWLCFRLMFSSGLVKLLSHCPLWWNLAALDVHFESQCIPTWIAYYAHQTQKWLRHLAVAITFYILIILPPMFFLPLKTLRTYAFFPQILLMVLIMLTGNYNFFNIICALLCLPILVSSNEYNFCKFFIFINSFVPFASISKSAKSAIPSKIVHLHDSLNYLQLTHAYGLFRRFYSRFLFEIFALFLYKHLVRLYLKSMTGAHGRPEVIIEGSYDAEGPWIPFHFYAKPGRLDEMPRFIIPHQPRLDWQMWFAALGAYQQNPFFISLIYHLLRNNTDVTYLMKKYPFERKLPTLIRAQLYFYHYTKPNHRGEWPKNYWMRNFQEEYMPPITMDHPGVLSYLQQNGFVLKVIFN
uniref:Lipase maturation factor n=1 Tax=Dracunculus medinensis TaxID=318479 RepID=A0A0N4UHC0_DRAME